MDVYGTYNYIVNGVYKPSYNWGAPHCTKMRIYMTFPIRRRHWERDSPRPVTSLQDLAGERWYQPSSKRTNWGILLYLLSMMVMLMMMMMVMRMMMMMMICVHTYIYIYTHIHLSIYPSVHLSIYPSIHLSIYPSIHLFIYPSIYPSIHLLVMMVDVFFPKRRLNQESWNISYERWLTLVVIMTWLSHLPLASHDKGRVQKISNKMQSPGLDYRSSKTGDAKKARCFFQANTDPVCHACSAIWDDYPNFIPIEISNAKSLKWLTPFIHGL